MTVVRDQAGPKVSESWLTVLLLWGAGICAAMQFSKISIGYLQFQAVLGVDAAHVSALMGAAGFVGLLFGISGADFTARIGFRKVLIWSLISASLLSIAETVIPPFPVFYFLRLLEGASNLFIVIAAPTLMAQMAPRGRVALAMGLWGSFYDAAFAITGVFGPALMKQGGTAALLMAHGAVSLTLAAMLWQRSLKDDAVHPAGTSTGILHALRLMVGANIGAYRTPATALPGMIFFFISALYLGFVMFVPLLSPSIAAGNLLSITLPVMSILGALLAGPIGQTGFGPARTLALGFPVLGGLAMALFAALHQTGSPMVYGAVANALVFVSGTLQGSVFVLVTRLASKAEDEATAFGAIAQLGSLGSIVGPIAFAIAIQRYGFIGLVALVGAGVLIVCPIALASVRALAGTARLLARAEA